MSYQEIKPLRRQIERYINRGIHHLRADHSAAAYRDFQNAFEILAELIARLDEEDTL
ncbi:hypothetical protein WH390_02580 [Candidatus Arsenophonus nilaparvatae]|uniref:hypothetical protein n=1 Tax=Candidatus Arsenophonus nilaparvatae TaxID=1247023 RepID=UPI0016515732|nr:hypothetical protein [Candidatus Arsenophonus nilaparvatae]